MSLPGIKYQSILIKTEIFQTIASSQFFCLVILGHKIYKTFPLMMISLLFGTLIVAKNLSPPSNITYFKGICLILANLNFLVGPDLSQFKN